MSDDLCCPAYPNCHEPVPGPLVEAPQPEPDFERYPYSGTAENEEWVKNGGSIVNGERWGWL